MGGEMVSESWFGSLRFSWNRVVEVEKPVVGILAFEVAGLMLKVVNLWNIVGEKEMLRLREEIVNSPGMRRLVADDDGYLMELALNEVIENLGYLAMSVVRLGKRCTDPVYHRFEEFFDDPLENGFQWLGWEYRWKKMERKVKKMERFVEATMQLSQEMEVLAELEQTLRRMRANPRLNRVKLLEFQQKVMWQRQEVKNLQEMSPWSRTYDYTVRLLARSLFTILERIKLVFGFDQIDSGEGNGNSEITNSACLSRSHSFSALMHSSVHPSDGNHCGFYSGPLGRSLTKQRLNASSKNKTNKQRQAHCQSSIQHGNYSQLKAKSFAHVGPFKGCMTGGSESPVFQSCKPEIGGSMRLRSTHMKHCEKYTHMGSQSFCHSIYSKLSLFSSKCTLLAASPSTLGDAALALHYANVIVLIENIASSPHLISLDARYDLYNMLTTTIRTALRARLKSYAKTMGTSVYDPALAGEWSLALEQILEWLAPLAHNMVRWHSERNFVKQQEVSKTNVLLVQTLHFANQAKTEAAIVELLIGLNCTPPPSNTQTQQRKGLIISLHVVLWSHVERRTGAAPCSSSTNLACLLVCIRCRPPSESPHAAASRKRRYRRRRPSWRNRRRSTVTAPISWGFHYHNTPCNSRRLLRRILTVRSHVSSIRRSLGGAGSETEGFVLAELAKTDIGPGPGDGVVPELVK